MKKKKNEKVALTDVRKALIWCYLVMLILGARGVYHWVSNHDPDSFAYSFKAVAEHVWQKVAKLGLEEPAYTAEVMFSEASGIEPDRPVKKYGEVVTEHLVQARKDKKAQWPFAVTKPTFEKPAKAVAQKSKKSAPKKKVAVASKTKAKVNPRLKKQRQVVAEPVDPKNYPPKEPLVLAAAGDQRDELIDLKVDETINHDKKSAVSEEKPPEVVEPQKAAVAVPIPADQELRKLKKALAVVTKDPIVQPKPVLESFHAYPDDPPPKKVVNGSLKAQKKGQKVAAINPNLLHKGMEVSPPVYIKRKGTALDFGSIKIPGPRFLLVGDSLMKGIGPTIAKSLRKKYGGFATVHSKVSSGLIRPEFFDWFGELPKNFIQGPFDVGVFLMGANDGQNVVKNGKVIRYGSKAWEQIYRQRLSRLMKIACNGVKKVYWLGLPPMRSKKLNRKTSRLNYWAKKEADAKSCVDFVPLEKIVGDQRGRYTAFLKLSRRNQRVRMSDGVHLSRNGGKLIGNMLISRIAINGSANSHHH